MTVEKKKWFDIKEEIHAKILNKTYPPGEKLPKDSDMAIEYNCARTTIQRAMRELAQLGIVERRRKGGTFVSQNRKAQAIIDIPIIHHEVESMNGTYKYQMLYKNIEPVPEFIEERWNMKSPKDVLHIQCIHMSDDTPYIYEDRWINTTVTPQILDVNLNTQSANEWLVKNCPYNEARVKIYAINADKELAKKLKINVNEAIIVINRTTWINNIPITTVRLFTKPGYEIISS